MTTQHQIIAICIIVFIAVPLGTFTTIKCIKKLTRVPENTLIRSGDIELNYIEPVHHGHVYQPIDSVNPNYINYMLHVCYTIHKFTYRELAILI